MVYQIDNTVILSNPMSLYVPLSKGTLHMNVPIHTYKDIAGKKIRATNQTEARTLRVLGATPLLLPTPETAEAIGRGTGDRGSR